MGVSDSGKQSWIREGALERAVLLQQGGPELVQGRRERLESPWVELRQFSAAANDVERGALVGAGLGEQERSVGEAPTIRRNWTLTSSCQVLSGADLVGVLLVPSSL